MGKRKENFKVGQKVLLWNFDVDVKLPQIVTISQISGRIHYDYRAPVEYGDGSEPYNAGIKEGWIIPLPPVINALLNTEEGFDEFN